MSTPSQARQKAPETQDPSLKNYLIGLDCFKKGDWDGAIDALLQSTYFARNGYAPLSFYYLGASYEAKHQDLKAIEAGKKYLEQGQDRADKGHLLLAELYLRNDRLDEASDECLTAMGSAGLTPENSRAHYLYGKVFESKKEYDEASDQYQEALGDPPWRYTEAWMALAEVQMKQKSWPSALNHFRSMLVSVHILNGLTHSNAGQNRVHRDMGKCLLMI